MVNHFVLTEKESQHKSCMDCGSNDGQNINSHWEAEADVVRHDNILKQGVADGNIAAICYCSQHVTLWNSKSAEEVELNNAFRVRNDVLLCHKVHQHFGGNDSGLTEVSKGQIAEEIVFGSVQVRTEPYQCDHVRVLHHRDHVDS